MSAEDRPPKIEFYRHSLGDEEAASWRQVLDTVFLTLGPQVAAFESELATYLVQGRGGEGARAHDDGRPPGGGDRPEQSPARTATPPYVIGTNSCSMGLILALRALDVGPGDEVITSPMTFASTANAILHVGARPVLADVEPTTGLLDPAATERAIGPKTRAILPVHLYGQLADMRAFRDIASKRGLAIVEDSAHGIEMERDGLRPGDASDAAVFSFYATKNLTSGDGGAIVTRDAALAERLRRLRNHGVSKAATDRHGQAYAHWDLIELGYKANLTDLDAALLRPQLARAEARRAQRQAIADRYEARLREAVPSLADPSGSAAGSPIPSFVERRGRSAHHLFTIQAPAHLRDTLLAHLGNAQIGTAVNYRAIHTLTYLRDALRLPRGTFPIAEEIGDRTVSLPFFPSLTEVEQDRVVAEVAKVLSPARRGVDDDRAAGGRPRDASPSRTKEPR